MSSNPPLYNRQTPQNTSYSFDDRPPTYFESEGCIDDTIGGQSVIVEDSDHEENTTPQFNYDIEIPYNSQETPTALIPSVRAAMHDSFSTQIHQEIASAVNGAVRQETSKRVPIATTLSSLLQNKSPQEITTRILISLLPPLMVRDSSLWDTIIAMQSNLEENDEKNDISNCEHEQYVLIHFQRNSSITPNTPKMIDHRTQHHEQTPITTPLFVPTSNPKDRKKFLYNPVYIAKSDSLLTHILTFPIMNTAMPDQNKPPNPMDDHYAYPVFFTQNEHFLTILHATLTSKYHQFLSNLNALSLAATDEHSRVQFMGIKHYLLSLGIPGFISRIFYFLVCTPPKDLTIVPTCLHTYDIPSVDGLLLFSTLQRQSWRSVPDLDNLRSRISSPETIQQQLLIESESAEEITVSSSSSSNFTVLGTSLTRVSPPRSEFQKKNPGEPLQTNFDALIIMDDLGMKRVLMHKIIPDPLPNPVDKLIQTGDGCLAFFRNLIYGGWNDTNNQCPPDHFGTRYSPSTNLPKYEFEFPKIPNPNPVSKNPTQPLAPILLALFDKFKATTGINLLDYELFTSTRHPLQLTTPPKPFTVSNSSKTINYQFFVVLLKDTTAFNQFEQQLKLSVNYRDTQHCPDHLNHPNWLIAHSLHWVELPEEPASFDSKNLIDDPDFPLTSLLRKGALKHLVRVIQKVYNLPAPAPIPPGALRPIPPIWRYQENVRLAWPKGPSLAYQMNGDQPMFVLPEDEPENPTQQPTNIIQLIQNLDLFSLRFISDQEHLKETFQLYLDKKVQIPQFSRYYEDFFPHRNVDDSMAIIPTPIHFAPDQYFSPQDHQTFAQPFDPFVFLSSQHPPYGRDIHQSLPSNIYPTANNRPFFSAPSSTSPHNTPQQYAPSVQAPQFQPNALPPPLPFIPSPPKNDSTLNPQMINNVLAPVSSSYPLPLNNNTNNSQMGHLTSSYPTPHNNNNNNNNQISNNNNNQISNPGFTPIHHLNGSNNAFSPMALNICPRGAACTHRSCRLDHPPDRHWVDQQCPAGAACAYQETTCKYRIHPQKAPVCKNDGLCTTRGCPSQHLKPRGFVNKPCMLSGDCQYKNSTCRFQHPGEGPHPL